MPLTHDERVSRYLIAIGNSLDAARVAYEMLIEELSEQAESVSTDCLHENLQDIRGQRLCDDCGTNLDEP